MSYQRKETIGGATLICGCCEAAMAEMTENQFELAIVDVPYGLGESKNVRGGTQYGNAAAVSKDYGVKEWDSSAPEAAYFEHLFRVSKNQIVWGANHFIDRLPIPSSCWIVWDKMTGNNGYADCELAWTSFKTAARLYQFQWSGMLQGNMKKKEHRIHATQKPVNLYTWLLKNYAKEGDHILDTHGGSMSSVIACLDMGFKITCYEIDEDYFDAGVRRVEEHVKQLRLPL
jgi:site-specific DNA-methyltransferase (adenine-specific)